MMIFSGIALTLVGIIHLLPVAGILGAEKLTALYGVNLQDKNLIILMQHRAVLFGLLGAFLIYSAFAPGLRNLAYIAAFISVITFLAIAWGHGSYNANINKVVIADIVALAFLCAGAIFETVGRHSSP